MHIRQVSSEVVAYQYGTEHKMKPNHRTMWKDQRAMKTVVVLRLFGHAG